MKLEKLFNLSVHSEIEKPNYVGEEKRTLEEKCKKVKYLDDLILTYWSRFPHAF